MTNQEFSCEGQLCVLFRRATITSSPQDAHGNVNALVHENANDDTLANEDEHSDTKLDAQQYRKLVTDAFSDCDAYYLENGHEVTVEHEVIGCNAYQTEGPAAVNTHRTLV